MADVNIKFNGIPYSVPEGITIIEAARLVGVNIPTLCYLKDINEIGACRICVVEVVGQRNLVASCVYPVSDGMEIITNSERVFNSRKHNLQLILSTHDNRCLACVQNGHCELQKICRDFGVDDVNMFDGEINHYEIDDSAEHMYRDNNKCILCRRCVAACEKVQGVSVIGPNERGFNTHIGCAFDQPLGDVACVGCGQCIVVCPTGAISEKDHTKRVWDAIQDPTKHVIVQTAPAIRATIGEMFDYPIGTNVEGKMVSALRRLGFDKIFDTNFGADATIMEEANEFIERLQNGGTLPMITSCSPGWVKFCEHNYPEMIPNLSSCKSPMQMLGAIIKTWYAEQNNIDPKDIFVVGVMPCTAKKFEIGRPDQSASGYPDVDAVLTTRELGHMISRAGIDFRNLPDEDFDNPLGESSGAGTIFGATGGVMEAALRTAAERITGKQASEVDFMEVRGTEGIKEATYNIGGVELNVCVCSGLANARKVLDAVKKGEKKYHFIEVMACPGGCINGGGQPDQPSAVRNFVDLKSLRAMALYSEDMRKTIRKSHENPAIQKLYTTYLGSPGSSKAHRILHTSYVERDKF